MQQSRCGSSRPNIGMKFTIPNKNVSGIIKKLQESSGSEITYIKLSSITRKSRRLLSAPNFIPLFMSVGGEAFTHSTLLSYVKVTDFFEAYK